MTYARIKSYVYGKDGALEYCEWDNSGPYLTDGKLYEVIRQNQSGRSFFIQGDDGFEILCLISNCAHLSGGDWELIEVE